METRHDIDSIIETIQTLTRHDAKKMIVDQKLQLQHITFDADALLKATKLLVNDYGKLDIIIEHFPINLNANIDKVINILEIMKTGQIESLIKKLKADQVSVLLKPKDFIKLLKKIGYEKASFILPIISVNFESITKSKAITDYMVEAFTYGLSSYKVAIDKVNKDKKFVSYKDAAIPIGLLNTTNLTELMRILEPLFARVTTFNEFYPLFSNFSRIQGGKYNEVLLAGDCYLKAKCALRERFQSLIQTQHELNELNKCLDEKNRGDFHKAQHDYWQSKSTTPANNNNALFNQNNNAPPSAPPAKEVGIAPEYLAPPKQEQEQGQGQGQGQELQTPTDNNNNNNNEEQPKQTGNPGTCRLM